jgi:ribosomal protein S18 acetylase RimI-like enzyme
VAPDFIDLKVGDGGFIGRIHLKHPDAGLIESLPRLGKLERPAYVIWGLHVHPLRRGKGWAGSLLVNAQRVAKLLHHDLYLWVNPYGNLPNKTKRQLQNLYRRFGFEHVATTDESWYFWAHKKQ